ncbi:MAG: hypothetical protein ACP5PQ_05750 [Thermoproteota archaeon]
MGAVDIDHIACKIYSDNLGFEPVCDDLGKLQGNEVLERFELREGDIDIV